LTIPISFPFFPGGRRKALTLSYDDGVVQDIRLLDILNRYGLKGTFHLNSGITGENKVPSARVAEVYRGHEISAHCVTHPWLTTLPLESLAWEILEDRRRLEALAGYPVRGMSYPYGDYNAEVLSRLPHYGIGYARTTRSHGQFSLPEDFLQWHPTCHHAKDLAAKTDEFLNAPNRAGRPLLFYVWGHSYEFDRNLENNNWEMIEAFAAKVAPEKETVWFATNIEIYDYLTALRRLRLGVSGRLVENQSHLTLWIAIEGKPHALAPGERLSI